MSNITTVAVLPPAVREYYDRLLLMTAYPMLIHTKFGQKRILPRKMGDTIVFRRYSRLATVPVPLQDGKINAVYKSSLIDLEAYVQQEAA
jgi:N4-gp56 family major capsid protein